jgi:DNA-binding beta-propeller fold protein YncE
MSNHTVITVVVAGLALLLSACAAPKKMVMHIGDPQDATESYRRFWPEPPEQPRFMYVGELTGEDNFTPAEDQSSQHMIARALRWLVGLGSEARRPMLLQRPQGITTDATGRVYVTDVGHQAIFVFDEAAGDMEIWTMVEPGRRFLAPVGITIGADGDLFVADAEHGSVFRFDREGKLVATIGEAALDRPTGVAWNPAREELYVADTRSHDIKVFDKDGNLVDRIGSPGRRRGEFNSPTYLAVANNRLYVADTLNARVQIFNLEGDALRHIGERGTFVGNMARPKGIAADEEGNIYVVESNFDHLLIYNSDGQLLLPIGGTGAKPGEFYLPAGIWIDPRNRIYIADMFNRRVVVMQYLGR